MRSGGGRAVRDWQRGGALVAAGLLAGLGAGFLIWGREGAGARFSREHADGERVRVNAVIDGASQVSCRGPFVTFAETTKWPAQSTTQESFGHRFILWRLPLRNAKWREARAVSSPVESPATVGAGSITPGALAPDVGPA